MKIGVYRLVVCACAWRIHKYMYINDEKIVQCFLWKNFPPRGDITSEKSFIYLFEDIDGLLQLRNFVSKGRNCRIFEIFLGVIHKISHPNKSWHLGQNVKGLYTVSLKLLPQLGYWAMFVYFGFVASLDECTLFLGRKIFFNFP